MPRPSGGSGPAGASMAATATASSTSGTPSSLGTSTTPTTVADRPAIVEVTEKGEGKGLAKGLGRWYNVQEVPHGPMMRRWIPHHQEESESSQAMQEDPDEEVPSTLPTVPEGSTSTPGTTLTTSSSQRPQSTPGTTLEQMADSQAIAEDEQQPEEEPTMPSSSTTLPSMSTATQAPPQGVHTDDGMRVINPEHVREVARAGVEGPQQVQPFKILGDGTWQTMVYDPDSVLNPNDPNWNAVVRALPVREVIEGDPQTRAEAAQMVIRVPRARRPAEPGDAGDGGGGDEEADERPVRLVRDEGSHTMPPSRWDQGDPNRAPGPKGGPATTTGGAMPDYIPNVSNMRCKGGFPQQQGYMGYKGYKGGMPFQQVPPRAPGVPPGVPQWQQKGQPQSVGVQHWYRGMGSQTRPYDLQQAYREAQQRIYDATQARLRLPWTGITPGIDYSLPLVMLPPPPPPEQPSSAAGSADPANAKANTSRMESEGEEQEADPSVPFEHGAMIRPKPPPQAWAAKRLATPQPPKTAPVVVPPKRTAEPKEIPLG
eukprot:s366_g65.t1